MTLKYLQSITNAKNTETCYCHQKYQQQPQKLSYHTIVLKSSFCAQSITKANHVAIYQ